MTYKRWYINQGTNTWQRLTRWGTVAGAADWVLVLGFLLGASMVSYVAGVWVAVAIGIMMGELAVNPWVQGILSVLCFALCARTVYRTWIYPGTYRSTL